MPKPPVSAGWSLPRASVFGALLVVATACMPTPFMAEFPNRKIIMGTVNPPCSLSADGLKLWVRISRSSEHRRSATVAAEVRDENGRWVGSAIFRGVAPGTDRECREVPLSVDARQLTLIKVRLSEAGYEQELVCSVAVYQPSSCEVG